MALGEDYNIFIMSRIREETGHRPSFREALAHAIGITGGTVTSAGIILAGTFVILGIVGRSNAEVEEVGFSIAFSILLDTFFVRGCRNRSGDRGCRRSVSRFQPVARANDNRQTPIRAGATAAVPQPTAPSQSPGNPGAKVPRTVGMARPVVRTAA